MRISREKPLEQRLAHHRHVFIVVAIPWRRRLKNQVRNSGFGEEWVGPGTGDSQMSTLEKWDWEQPARRKEGPVDWWEV